MKKEVLFELAARWELESVTPEYQDVSQEAIIPNAEAKGYRECKRECANTLLMLINLLEP